MGEAIIIIIKTVIGLLHLAVSGWFWWMLYKAKPDPDYHPSDATIWQFLIASYLSVAAPLIGLWLLR